MPKYQVKEYLNLSKAPTCVICKKIGKPSSHKTSDLNCPVYIRSLEGEARKTHYGQ